MNDPRARNSARLRLEGDVELTPDGTIRARTTAPAATPAQAAKPTRSVTTFAPSSSPTTAEIRDKLNDIVLALTEAGLIRQVGGNY